MEKLRSEQPRMLSEDDRTTLLAALADDLPRVWNHPQSSVERCASGSLRAVLKEIIVTIDGDRLCADGALARRKRSHRLDVVKKSALGQNRFQDR